jgi:hypothetical protein
MRGIMKKLRYLLAVILLGFFASVSLASTTTYYMAGSSDSGKFKKSRYISFNSRQKQRNISINYNIDSNLNINSAKLWIRAVDDFRGVECFNKFSCADIKNKRRDLKEKLRITKIEGQSGRWASSEVNNGKWYELLDVTTFLLNDKNNNFSAQLKSIAGRDFWFRNAKLVIDYDNNTDSAPPADQTPPLPAPPPSEVPLPSALWLFGSALFGVFGLKRKARAATAS